MLLRRKRGWEIAESRVTPEAVYFNRRSLLVGGSAAAAGAAAMFSNVGPLLAQAATDPTLDLYPAVNNPRYTVERPVTAQNIVESYNNFYEYGKDKDVAKNTGRLKTRPWTIVVDGLVEQPFRIAIDDLIRKFPLEERIYRHRCVEAWSFVVPWTGFQLSKLAELAKPTAAATHVTFETFDDPRMAPALTLPFYAWPYVESVTMAEARNELAFLVVGSYGKPVANVNGAPIRLHLPWKYGFKSIKSIVRVSFVSSRAKSFWERTSPREYGFWANVNPEVPHPRWSQEMEHDLGTGSLIPTQLFNGYGEFVAGLYSDPSLKDEKLYF